MQAKVRPAGLVRWTIPARGPLSATGGGPPSHRLAQERLTVFKVTQLLAVRRRAHIGMASVSSGTDACVLVGAVMPAPRWAIGGGVTHFVHPLGSRHYECVSDD
jgi:hypothetical protein